MAVWSCHLAAYSSSTTLNIPSFQILVSWNVFTQGEGGFVLYLLFGLGWVGKLGVWYLYHLVVLILVFTFLFFVICCPSFLSFFFC